MIKQINDDAVYNVAPKKNRMTKIFNKVIGDLSSKREWRETQKRAKALPKEYRLVYFEIQRYLFSVSGILDMGPLRDLVILFEQSAAEKKRVLEVIGDDVAAFADDLVQGQRSYFDKKRSTLNQRILGRLSVK
jgi:DNA-binding ferritin-like protein (Dps family)